jgi:prolyl-tRNA synthetase
MKDAYSFDQDLDGLHQSYDKMFNAYKNIFDRVGVNYKIVKSDTGAMGGLLSEEFQAVTEIGEDVLVLCDDCGYASNLEIAQCVTEDNNSEIESGKYTELSTPGTSTIEKLAKYTNVDSHDLVKCMVVKADGELIACLISGDKELNDVKLQKLIGASEITLPEKSEIEAQTKAVIGYAGPIGLDIKVVIDNEVMQKRNFICGANKVDTHFENVNISDFEYIATGDIINIKDGGVCPNCGKAVHFARGIEIGNTFKLGTKYSEALGLEYADKDNKLHNVWMGSYGIGIGRIMASLVEQNADDNGLIWPIEIAPYKVSIIRISDKDEKQIEIADTLYNELNKAGIETILDDRKARAGVKFNDADLIGVPIRITVGKKVNENQIEFKLRSDSEATLVEIDKVIETIKELIK